MKLIGQSESDSLTVREFEDADGTTVLELSAPQGTPMNALLASYEGREEEFREWFLQTLKDRLEELESGGQG